VIRSRGSAEDAVADVSSLRMVALALRTLRAASAALGLAPDHTSHRHAANQESAWRLLAVSGHAASIRVTESGFGGSGRHLTASSDNGS
jgi:hypothetical protein